MSENIAASISKKPLLTTKEVADILQVSTMTILRWVDEGLLPAIKVRYTVRFREEDIKQFIEEHYVKAAKERKNKRCSEQEDERPGFQRIVNRLRNGIVEISDTKEG